MLMLVVTIIIAALVSSFAGGITASQEKAPVATLSVSIPAAIAGYTQPNDYVYIEHLGGDVLKTKELRIVTTYTVPEKYGRITLSNAGKTIKHTIDGSLERTGQNTLNKNLEGYPFTPQTNTIEQNLFNNVGSVGQYFDDAAVKAGQKIQIISDYFLGFNPDEKKEYGFAEGSVVHVTITHIPSNKVIYDQDVVATW